MNGSYPYVAYTPNADFNGTDTFTLSVYDIEGTLLGTPVFNVTVNPVNDMPEYLSIQVDAGELEAGVKLPQLLRG